MRQTNRGRGEQKNRHSDGGIFVQKYVGGLPFAAEPGKRKFNGLEKSCNSNEL